MRPGVLIAVATMLIAGVCLAADESSVIADPKADFASFKTFAMHDGTIGVQKPELDNPLFVKKLGRAIASALETRGLTPGSGRPDLIVEYTITGQDFGRGMRPFRVGPRVPVRFTEGTLVIDLLKPDDPSPVWRGVYKDEEKTGSKLVDKLPEDAKALIDKYPRLKQ